MIQNYRLFQYFNMWHSVSTLGENQGASGKADTPNIKAI